jgi:hypothetical protein
MEIREQCKERKGRQAIWRELSFAHGTYVVMYCCKWYLRGF